MKIPNLSITYSMPAFTLIKHPQTKNDFFNARKNHHIHNSLKYNENEHSQLFAPLKKTLPMPVE